MYSSSTSSLKSGLIHSASNANFENSNVKLIDGSILEGLIRSSSACINNMRNCKFLPQLPLEKYQVNQDPNPEILRRKPAEKLHYTQNVSVKYLNPPEPPKHGDLIIKQLQDRQVAPAPPLHIKETPERLPTPPPIIIREVPPTPPPQIPAQIIQVPGKIIPPPPRKLVVEKLPLIPAKPQQIVIERWLPYQQQTRRIVHQPAEPPCILQTPKNLIIQWESPDVEISQEFSNLGIHQADPNLYIKKYGSNLIRAEQMPSIASNLPPPTGFQLAAKFKPSDIPILVGDIEALKLIDLNSHGLSAYASRIHSNN